MLRIDRDPVGHAADRDINEPPPLLGPARVDHHDQHRDRDHAELPTGVSSPDRSAPRGCPEYTCVRPEPDANAVNATMKLTW
jgi:hypothetical protein